MPTARTDILPFDPARVLAGVLWGGLCALQVAALIGRARGFAIDGLTLAIGSLTLFVGANVAAFSTRYMRADRHRARYVGLVGALVASVLVVVASANMAVLAAGWIASGHLLAGLICHDATNAEARAAARRARIAFAVGDAAMVVALGMLAVSTGTLQIPTALAMIGATPARLLLTVALLMLVAAMARCALPPFSGWLLSSMTAPTPVSALMHAGLVNAGGFLLLRFAPVFEAAPLARLAALVAGLIAVVWGLGIMMVRPDIKRSLAGSTVSQMGFMIMSCGLGAYAAALWHIIAHGLFKAWLFLGSGSAVGMKPVTLQRARADHAPALIAGLVLAGGVLLVARGQATGTLVPLLLGCATAGVTLTGAMRSALDHRARLSLVVIMGALVGFHIAGLALIESLSRADAPSIVPPWLLIWLVAGFLLAWVWQLRRQAQGSALPHRLYVHLLNAGALGGAAAGDVK